jgi:hypothetical protein
LQVSDEKEARRRAKFAVPLINAVSEERLMRDIRAMSLSPIKY